MSDEEKEAIEYLKENALVRIDNKGNIIATGNSYKLIILNLIDKLQKEIEYEKELRLRYERRYNLVKESKDNLKLEISKLEEENTSLKKEIKLMKSVNINKNFISKNKIRNKIKELEKTQAYKIGLEEFTIRVLKELLGDDDD